MNGATIGVKASPIAYFPTSGVFIITNIKSHNSSLFSFGYYLKIIIFNLKNFLSIIDERNRFTGPFLQIGLLICLPILSCPLKRFHANHIIPNLFSLFTPNGRSILKHIIILFLYLFLFFYILIYINI